MVRFSSMTHAVRQIAWVAGALAVLSSGAPSASASETLEEQWYVMNLQDQKAGWMVDRLVREDDGSIRTEAEMNLTIGRGPSAVTITFENAFRESADGKPLMMSTRQRQGQLGLTSTYVFLEDGIHEVTEQLDRKRENTHPLPEAKWLTPNQARHRIESLIETGAVELSYTTMDPTLGPRTFDVTTKIVGRTNVEVLGKTVPAVEWESRQSYLPDVVSREFVNDRGVPLRTRIDLGGIQIDILAADKEIALAPAAAPELMASTLVALNKPIDNARSLRRSWFRVSHRDGDAISIPETSVQSVKELEGGAIRVVVDLDQARPAPASDVSNRRFLDASPTIDCEDPEIRSLVETALAGSSTNVASKAEALRRFVHTYIDEKGLGVGLATASEVCRTRQGDCSEHAVLLAAMLRAAGIPSRLASGVVYVDEFLGKQSVLGYHMWTQALIPQNGVHTWVDVDAALGGERPFDATHICFSLSSGAADGEDSVINSLVPIATMLGTLVVEVENVQ